MHRPKGVVIWLTGLPCSGKSTISDSLFRKLKSRGISAEKLDGDIIRKNLSSGLGFSKIDREENIRRVAFIAALLSQHGVTVIVSVVSPYRKMRKNARAQIHRFVEVYVRCPLSVCENRDVKGMYALARQGKIASFTGVSDPYEEPLRAEIILDTDKMNLADCVEKILLFLKKRKLLSLPTEK